MTMKLFLDKQMLVNGKPRHSPKSFIFPVVVVVVVVLKGKIKQCYQT